MDYLNNIPLVSQTWCTPRKDGGYFTHYSWRLRVPMPVCQEEVQILSKLIGYQNEPVNINSVEISPTQIMFRTGKKPREFKIELDNFFRRQNSFDIFWNTVLGSQECWYWSRERGVDFQEFVFSRTRAGVRNQKRVLELMSSVRDKREVTPRKSYTRLAEQHLS